MLFNSVQFIFVSRAVTLTGFFLLGGAGFSQAAIARALLAALAFCGTTDPIYLLPIIVISVAYNFGVDRLLATRKSKWLITFGVAADGTIGKSTAFLYFKF